MKALRSLPKRNSGRGIVLPVVLIMLLVLTISSVVIVEQISTQTRMATSAGTEQVTLQAAETGLMNVYGEIGNGTISSQMSTYANNKGGYYLYSAANYPKGTPPPFTPGSSAWTGLPSTNTSLSTCTNGVSTVVLTSCKFMVEMLPKVNSSKGVFNVFRITVQVVGPSGHGLVMLQSIYKQPAS